MEKFRMTLRLDQMLIVLIAGMILYTLVFSFGVEKGKRFAWKEIQAERQKREEMIREFRAQLIAYQNAIPGMKTDAAAPAPVRVEAVAVKASPKAAEGGYPTQAAPAAQIETAAPVVAEPIVHGKYTIQSVTYKSQTDADRQIQKLVQAGLQPFVIPSGSMLQVCINGFESKKEATEKLKQLKTQGLVPRDSYVRNMPHDIAGPTTI